MGQYWKMVNVDKAERVRMSNRGLKMWEILASGGTGALVKLLTVPRSRDTVLSEGGLRRGREHK